ncbi:MAG: hypothetical protein B7X35_04085 [Halothiobacillus sp. 14-56-357]|jgi:hypothetical protein|uniref:hypothetical protein n=1 Tax=Halothiobacillus sp. 15-55-196 TaxID=1970382 RepID=UPI000BCA9E43|nr:hypothetical protein [Halothiobacillus sp. 15-55-196]OZB36077.1 MAG: hypothetical protein B7X44_07395 [Halothiobacillus sp. 15-55-196]OZB56768.1 MAG: hypothetical protein B7X35_04085 [Halothiobacillus sp. 14-56-357]OZB77657.1 MAG: hypothetical protein B7X29_07770 [Halothiobacillus sp. 13-55-115]
MRVPRVIAEQLNQWQEETVVFVVHGVSALLEYDQGQIVIQRLVVDVLVNGSNDNQQCVLVCLPVS